MDILSKLQSQAEQVEVLSLQSESTEIGFEANRLKSSQIRETRGVAVRVVKDGRLGFAASSDMSALDKLVSNALESAAYGDKVPIVFPGPQPGPEVVTYDQAIVDMPISRLVEIGQEIVGMIRGIEPDAKVSVKLSRGVQNATIRNQTGTDVAFKMSPLSMSFQIQRIQGDDVLMMFAGTGTTIWEEDYMAFARTLGKKLELAKKNATLESGQMPVIFSPTGALVLARPLMQGLDGKSVYSGISPIKDRIGEKLFDTKLTIVDDATIDGKFSSATYDDEGVPHRRNVLVGNGVLQGFLYDLKTAALSGVESTGNGSRSLFGPPSPSATNLVFEAGDTPVADMIAQIDHGLLVEGVLGMGQGNTISGAFSNPVALAFKIEKGEIVGRVKDVSIAGNVYDLLPNITAVSQESDWVYRFVNMPYILLDDMNVVAKA